MIDIHQSEASEGKHNQALTEMEFKPKENNIDWMNRANKDLSNTKDHTLLVLLGGSDTSACRLRYTQAYARQNLTPSNWSHVLLLDKLNEFSDSSSTWEMGLHPSSGFDFPPDTNAVQKGKLKPYKNPEAFPNIALLAVPVDLKGVKKAVKKFTKRRNIINGPDLVITWLGYLWGATGSRNPLLEECGIPSAVLVEYALGSAGFDLTPGLASRSSCPEAIWQAAKWWHDYYAKAENEEGEKVNSGLSIIGRWSVNHELN